MTTHKYILIDPNDDSGNDDGVLDRMEMTEAEANDRNSQRRENKDNRRWVKNVASKLYNEEYFE
jgi:hypothetical protein